MAVTLDDLDRSRALRTPAELRELVEAIRDSPPDSQETNWVEWKSGLDLSSKEGRFSIARAVLGFANREVTLASNVFEGVAYMVVGAEPGAVAGVTVIDSAKLEQGVRTYLDGPRWTPHYVQVDGKDVLVIAVEPPRPGDTIHTLLKEYSSDKPTESTRDKDRPAANRRGTVFHRGAARTEQAGPAEIEMLVQRRVDGTRQPGVELAMAMTALPLIRLDLSPDALDEWMQQHERSIRANSGAPKQPPAAPRTPAGAGTFGLPTSYLTAEGYLGSGYREQDARTFEAQVSEYLDAKRAALLPQLVGAVVRSNGNKVSFVVTNDSDDSITGVQLTVRFPRNEIVVRSVAPRARSVPTVPRWPDPLDLKRWPSHLPTMPSGGDQIVEVISKEWIEATFEIGDLRPRERDRTVALTVVPTMHAPDMIPLKLTARAMDRRGTTTEEAALVVGDDSWGPAAFLDSRVEPR